jgi:adenylylsulfate kinase-like enzyme
MTSPYEEPQNANLTIDTDKNNADLTAKLLNQYIDKIGRG